MENEGTLRLKLLTNSVVVFLCSFSSAFAIVENDSKQVVKTVSYEHVLNWSLGLIMVLLIFFACVWFMRKMGALPINSKQSMRVIGGVSLGMREKLIVVQVGEKQLVLGVTPGRIDKLLLLEGNEQIFKAQSGTEGEGDFSSKLKQLMTGPANE